MGTDGKQQHPKLKIGRQTLSTLASTLLDLCFLVTGLCRAEAKIDSRSVLPRLLRVGAFASK
jgi:hypothetical protein